MLCRVNISLLVIFMTKELLLLPGKMLFYGCETNLRSHNLFWMPIMMTP